MELFEGVEHQILLKIDEKYKVILNHYPFLCYAGTYRSPNDCVIQLHGHVHQHEGATGKDIKRLQYRFPYQYDVGVDNNNYTPVSWREILSIIDNQYKLYKDDSTRID